MVWTTPKIWEPQETVTAADLNLYLRDNLLETEIPQRDTVLPDGGQIIVAAGPHQVTSHSVRDNYVTASTVSTSSTTPAQMATGVLGIPHTGTVLFILSAIMRTTSGTATASFGLPDIADPRTDPSIQRGVRTATSDDFRASAHVIHYRLGVSPITADLYLWTTSGTATATITLRTIPL